MALSSILSKLTAKEKAQEQFLAIEIGSETVTTAVWRVIDGQTQIVNVGSTEEWELVKGSHEELLVAIDTSLQKALEGIEPEPNKVIFGLQETWVEGEAITKEYARFLRQICKKFEFIPVGFVVTTEAIIQLLKREEGTPPTAILIRVNQSEIQVTLVSLGKVTGTEVIARSEDIGADVEEGLARFEATDNFPSRMLLYNATLDLESIKQDLLSYSWLEKLPFLHFPKVEVLEKQVTIRAVAIAGGAEAAVALGFGISEEEQEPEESQEEVKAEEILEPEEQKAKTEALPEAEEIGFKLETDVYQPKLKEPEEAEEKGEQKEPSLPTEPIAPKKEKPEQPPVKESWKAKLKHLLGLFPHLPSIRRPKLPNVGAIGTRIKVAVAVVLGFFALVFGAGLYGYWTIPKAKLTLYVKPRTLEEELTVTIDPETTQINSAKNLIPGKIVEIEVENTKEKDSTGKKVVGEKATGEVTLYNKTSAAKTFPVGTTLTGPNNLVFLLDSQVTVASASAQESDEAMTTVFGKAKVKLTAASIGTEYNLPANTDLAIKGFSTASYDAKNEAALSGGTSREVTAISEGDIENLLTELTADLKQQGAAELEKQEGEGRKVLSDGAKTEVITKKVSGNAEDEAQNVSATLRLKVRSLAYNEENLGELLKQAVSEAIPAGFELQKEESQTEVRSTTVGETSGQLVLLYKAVLVPQIQTEDIKQELKGKFPNVALEYLDKLPNVVRVDIEISPKGLPPRLKHFPRLTKNISIEVKVEEE